MEGKDLCIHAPGVSAPPGIRDVVILPRVVQVEPEDLVDHGGVDDGAISGDPCYDLRPEFPGCQVVAGQDIFFRPPEKEDPQAAAEVYDGFVLLFIGGGHHHHVARADPGEPLQLVFEERLAQYLPENLSRQPGGAHPSLDNDDFLHFLPPLFISAGLAIKNLPTYKSILANNYGI